MPPGNGIRRLKCWLESDKAVRYPQSSWWMAICLTLMLGPIVGRTCLLHLFQPLRGSPSQRRKTKLFVEPSNANSLIIQSPFSGLWTLPGRAKLFCIEAWLDTTCLSCSGCRSILRDTCLWGLAWFCTIDCNCPSREPGSYFNGERRCLLLPAYRFCRLLAIALGFHRIRM